MEATRLRKRPETFQAAQIDDELVMIHGQSGKFYALRGVGLDIWQRLDGEADLDRLCSALASEYDAADDTIRAQVRSFAEDIVETGFAEYC